MCHTLSYFSKAMQDPVIGLSRRIAVMNLFTSAMIFD